MPGDGTIMYPAPRMVPGQQRHGLTHLKVWWPRIILFGNVFVADTGNHTIRKITPTGAVTLFAGTVTAGAGVLGTEDTAAGPPAVVAKFSSPQGVGWPRIHSFGDVYVADSSNHTIRRITTPEAVVSLFAGTAGRAGATSAGISSPSGVAVDSSGNVYVTDYSNHLIRKITSEGVVTTLAGSTRGYKEGAGTAARFKAPTGVAVDSSGNVYVADNRSNRIRKIEYK